MVGDVLRSRRHIFINFNNLTLFGGEALPCKALWDRLQHKPFAAAMFNGESVYYWKVCIRFGRGDMTHVHACAGVPNALSPCIRRGSR